MNKVNVFFLLLGSLLIASCSNQNKMEMIGTTGLGGYPLVKYGDKYGFYDKENDKILKPSEIDFFPKNINRYSVTLDGISQGYIDGEGNMAIAPLWDFVCPFDGNKIARVINLSSREHMPGIITPAPGKYGYIDVNGKYVIPMDYSYVDLFYDSVTVTRFNRGVYDTMIDPNLNPFEGYKYGLINTQGKIILADDTYDFISHPMANAKGDWVFRVHLGEKLGVIDTTGKVVFEPVESKSYSGFWKMYNAQLK